MSIISDQPTDRNFLSPLNIHFSLGRAPNLVYNVQKINLPKLTVGNAKVDTLFGNVPLGGDRVIWDPLNVTFKIDEDMLNYQEIFNWLTALGIQNSFANSAALGANVQVPAFQPKGRQDVIVVTIMDAAQNPNITITYEGVYPETLECETLFDITKVDVVYADAIATFVYKNYYITNLNSNPSD